MKNYKQESNEMRAIRQCGRAAMTNGACKVALVSLKVDYRTHCHTQGLLAIVYEDSGGILVCVSMESSLMTRAAETIGCHTTITML